jgi:hypothetical protein
MIVAIAFPFYLLQEPKLAERCIPASNYSKKGVGFGGAPRARILVQGKAGWRCLLFTRPMQLRVVVRNCHVQGLESLVRQDHLAHHSVKNAPRAFINAVW